MKKNNLLLLASLTLGSQSLLVSSSTQKPTAERVLTNADREGQANAEKAAAQLSETSFASKLTLLPRVIEAAGAFYALTATAELLTQSEPNTTDTKKLLAYRIQQAKAENKVWAGISVFLGAYLTGAAISFVNAFTAKNTNAAIPATK